MAHPQHNFTSNFNGSEDHNAELTLNINGVDQRYTPAGSDQTYNVPGVARIDIDLDGAELVQAIQTVLDGAAQPVLVEMSIYDEETVFQYIGELDNNWCFVICTTEMITRVSVSKEDGAIADLQVPVGNGIVIVQTETPNIYAQLRAAIARGQLPVLKKSSIIPEAPDTIRNFYYWPTTRTGTDGGFSFMGCDGQHSEIATVHQDNSVTYSVKPNGVHRLAKKYVEVEGEFVMTLGDGDRCSVAEPDGETVTKSELLAWLDAGETLIFSFHGFDNYQKCWGIAEDVRVYGSGSSRTVNVHFHVRTDNEYLFEHWQIYTTNDSEFVTLQQEQSVANEATANKVQVLDDTTNHYPSCPAVKNAIETAVSSAYHAAGVKTVTQLTSSLLVAANQGNVYNITDSGTTTADFVEGAGHPIVAGDNVGICDVGGGVYKFDLLSGFVDLNGYLAKTGDGSDVTASFTAASTRTNVTTGEKLSILFGKIAKWFNDLKALAFKDKVNTADIEDDAVTADKVKDNETLPANVTGSAKSLSSSLSYYGSSGSKFRLVAKSAPLGHTVDVHFECRISASNYSLYQSATLLFNAVYSQTENSITFSNVRVINDHGSSNLWRFYLVPNVVEHKVEIYAESIGSAYNSLNLIALFASGEYQNYINGTTYFNTVVNSIPTPNVVVPVRTAVSTETGVGNAATPVYIDNKGVPQPCDIRGVNTVVAEFTHTLTSSEVSNGYFEFTIVDSTAFTSSSKFGAIKNATLYNELILLKTSTVLNHDAVCFDIAHYNYNVDSASMASYVRWPLIMGKNISTSMAKGLLSVPIENSFNGTLSSIVIRVFLPQGIFAANDTIHVEYNVTTIR